MIKHLTIDVWGTLIKSNPEYSTNKALYLKEKFGLPHQIEDIKKIWRKVDKYFDERDMTTGTYAHLSDRLLSVLAMLNITPLTAGNLEDLHEDICDIFMRYPPTCYTEDTLYCLVEMSKLVESVTVISNTGTIQGSHILQVIDNLGLGKYIQGYCFSDSIGYSKPNPQMFQVAIKDCVPSEVLHVGDSIVADGLGAKRAGIKYFIINKTEYRIWDAFDHLTKLKIQ